MTGLELVLTDVLDGRTCRLEWWPNGHAFVITIGDADVVVGVNQAARLASALTRRVVEMNEAHEGHVGAKR